MSEKPEHVHLKRLSICSCGALVLNPDCHIGKSYYIYPSTISGKGTYYCGSCGEIQTGILIVDTEQSNGRKPMPLPLALFDYVSWPPTIS